MDTIPASLTRLLRLMEAEVSELRAGHAELMARPDVQRSHAYLSTWFPSRIESLERQQTELSRLVAQLPLVPSLELAHCFGWFRSLGQAFDVDLTWSPRGDAVFTRLGEMQRLALELRSQLRPAVA